MKYKLLALLAFLLMFGACGEDSSPEEVEPVTEVTKDSIPTITGEFIFLADAAVLKGKDFIYGVQIDSLSKKLADTVAPLKRDEFEMIEVTVKGKIVQNPGQTGWEELVQIKEIVEISKKEGDSIKSPNVSKDIEKP